MTKRYAVIGDPVIHSLSPLMHTGWIADHGLDATYEAHLLRSDDPVAAIRGLTQFAGMNVTVPHKEAAAAAADRGEGAVANVLRWEADGSLAAFNTDGAGFLVALDETAPDWRRQTMRAAIIGAGGAGLAIGRALAEFVPRVGFINRTSERAEAAAASVKNALPYAWSELETIFGGADLIVQATMLGMEGQSSHKWPVESCVRNPVVADIVYRPLETDLLRAARRRGLRTVDGLGLLIHQGALSFEIWHGIRPDVAKARERLETVLT